MSQTKKFIARSALIVVGLAGGSGVLFAQSANRPSGAAGNAAATKSAGAKDVTSDGDQKAAILASDSWRNVEKEFSQWLAVQVVYTPTQVKQMQAKLRAEVQKMSAAELRQFVEQWNAKLKVLLGKDAVETREWLGQYLSVIADGYRPKFLKKIGITDVTDLSAAQIEDELIKLRAERLGFQQQRAAFDVGRQEDVARAQEFHAQQREVLQQSGIGRAAEYGAYQSQYSPRQYDYRPLPPLVPFFW